MFSSSSLHHSSLVERTILDRFSRGKCQTEQKEISFYLEKVEMAK